MESAKQRLHFALALAIVVSLLSACVSGAPTLTAPQERKLQTLSLYQSGQSPEKPYTVLGTISAADCSGAPLGGRTSGNVDRALDTLKRKAAAMNADAVIDVSCGAAPLLNNCWAAQKCTGRAITFPGAAATTP